MRLRDTSFRDPKSYFKQYAELGDEEAHATALFDLAPHQSRQPARARFLPTRGSRRTCNSTKGASHRIEEVALRKL